MYSWWAILKWILVGLLAKHVRSEACGYPGSPAHAVVEFTEEVINPGTVAIYSCEAGFELLGPTRRICNDNGTWTPPGIPFCVLNVAAGKAPMQSSIVGAGVPQKGVDGSTSTFFNGETCTMTEPERSPWWYVNLLEPYVVQLVRVDFGMSCCSSNRPATIVVRVGNNRPDLDVNPICNKFTGFLEEGRPLFLPCSTPMPGAFVSIHFESPAGIPLSICEAFVYTDQALPIERCKSFRDQPPGSTSTYNGKCYLFYNNRHINFEAARNICEERGGSLVDETSPALQGFLSWELFRRHRIDPNGYWLGAVRDPEDRKNWKWINGNDVTISFWNLPGTNENCSRFDGKKGWLWSDTNCEANLNFICQHRPTTCGAPERAANSTILARNYEVGSVIEYRCAAGHLLIGPNIRTCLPNGFFSEFPPKCKYLECGPPADIANGAYDLVPENTRHYFSSVKYSCGEGFVLVGKRHLVCDVDERWNGPPPRCEAVLCRSPPPVSHGGYTLSSNSTTFGTRAEYSCEPGFSIADTSVLTCQSSGFWDGDAPVCAKDPGARDEDYEATSASNVVSTTVRSYSIPEEHLSTAEHIPVSIYTRRPPPSTSSSSSTSTTFSYIPPTTTTTSKPPTKSSMFPTWKPPFLQKSTTEVPIVTFSPEEDNEIPDTINIRTIPGSNSVDIGGHKSGSRKKELPMSTTAKLNMGGIIALGVFGGFVFLAAIITVIVIIVRRRSTSKIRRSQSRTSLGDIDQNSAMLGSVNLNVKQTPHSPLMLVTSA